LRLVVQPRAPTGPTTTTTNASSAFANFAGTCLLEFLEPDFRAELKTHAPSGASEPRFRPGASARPDASLLPRCCASALRVRLPLHRFVGSLSGLGLQRRSSCGDRT